VCLELEARCRAESNAVIKGWSHKESVVKQGWSVMRCTYCMTIGYGSVFTWLGCKPQLPFSRGLRISATVGQSWIRTDGKPQMCGTWSFLIAIHQ
jgi:hypothetical protein